jgi:hypothetical protein
MQQKAMQELLALKRHHLVTVTVTVVRAPKGGVLAIDAGNARVADDDAVARLLQCGTRPFAPSVRCQWTPSPKTNTRPFFGCKTPVIGYSDISLSDVGNHATPGIGNVSGPLTQGFLL